MKGIGQDGGNLTVGFCGAGEMRERDSIARPLGEIEDAADQANGRGHDDARAKDEADDVLQATFGIALQNWRTPLTIIVTATKATNTAKSWRSNLTGSFGMTFAPSSEPATTLSMTGRAMSGSICPRPR